jgi:hypothetical protein
MTSGGSYATRVLVSSAQKHWHIDMQQQGTECNQPWHSVTALAGCKQQLASGVLGSLRCTVSISMTEPPQERHGTSFSRGLGWCLLPPCLLWGKSPQPAATDRRWSHRTRRQAQFSRTSDVGEEGVYYGEATDAEAPIKTHQQRKCRKCRRRCRTRAHCRRGNSDERRPASRMSDVGEEGVDDGACDKEAESPIKNQQQRKCECPQVRHRNATGRNRTEPAQRLMRLGNQKTRTVSWSAHM